MPKAKEDSIRVCSTSLDLLNPKSAFLRTATYIPATAICHFLRERKKGTRIVWLSKQLLSIWLIFSPRVEWQCTYVCPDLSPLKPLDQSKNVTVRSYHKLPKDQNGPKKSPKSCQNRQIGKDPKMAKSAKTSNAPCTEARRRSVVTSLFKLHWGLQDVVEYQYFSWIALTGILPQRRPLKIGSMILLWTH